MAQHSGFSIAAVDFYARLESNNSKDFWADNKAVYATEVRNPMRELLAALEPEFGPGTVFRPHRNLRFSKDKTPYKTHQGAFVGIHPGIGYYVQLDAAGLLAGGGFHVHGASQVDRYREAVDDDTAGSKLAHVVHGLRGKGFEIGGDQLKTKPRGYAADHPRLELLRYRELMAMRRFGVPDWLDSPQALEEVREVWRQVRPLSEWVAEHVGAA